MYFRKEYRGWVEVGPILGESVTQYFKNKQLEIGKSRYQWKEIDIYNIDDKEFQLINIKTDFLYFHTRITNQTKG